MTMHVSRTEVLAVAWAALLSVSCAGPLGLLGLIVPSNQEAFVPRRIIDGEGDTVLVARTHMVPPSVFFQAALNPFVFGGFLEARTDIGVLDVGALTARTIVRDIPQTTFRYFAPFFEIVGNERWIAWTGDALGVGVANVRTQEQFRLFDSPQDPLWADAVALTGDHLVAFVSDPNASTGRLVVVDLNTREVNDLSDRSLTRYQDTWNAGEGMVAILRNPDPNATDADANRPDALLVLDVATGERLASLPLLEHWPGYFLAIVPSRVLWTETDYEANRKWLRALDVGSGEVTTLAELDFERIAEDGSETSEDVLVAGASGYLLSRTHSLLAPSGDWWDHGQTTIEYRGYDGSAQTVLEYDWAFLNPPLFDMSPALSDGFVIYRHPFEGDFVRFDLSTGRQERFDPFAD